jgi:hypothetical protein
MEEHRQAPRHRTFKTGSITLPHGIVECLIRNMSEKGALLEFLRPALIPDIFTLLIKPDMTQRPCRVARRKDLRIGVEFNSLRTRDE